MKMKLLPKFIFSLAVLAIILTFAISLFSYQTSKTRLEGMYADRVTINCQTIASMLSVEDVKEILAPGGEESEVYGKSVELFNNLKQKGKITYLSLVVPDPEAVTFYIDAMVPEMGDDPANQLPYGTRILYTDAAYDEIDLQNYLLVWDLYELNKGLDEPVVTDNDYGYNYTSVCPILDENGQAIAEIQYILDMNDVRAYLNGVLIRMIVISASILLISMIIYMGFVRRTVTRPIGKLADFTDNITKTKTFENQKISIRTGDEIETLSNSFNYMLEELGNYIVNLSRITAEKERIGAELNVATQIQADMLPRIFPFCDDRHEFELYATMTPAKEVGGDFYDFFLIDDDHLGLVMADVSGKGVPAALFMVIAKTLIKNRAQMGASPGEVLAYANEQLCEGNEAELFVTVWMAILELSTGKGVAVNAGHEHPALRRANGEYELVVYRHSPAVATMEGMRFREHSFELHPGDRLFVYTDGVTEATNARNELYGTDRMLNALNRNPDVSPGQLLIDVKSDIDAFVGSAPQFDDITMLSLYYNGPEEGDDMDSLKLSATLENLDSVLAFVDSQLEAADCPPKAQMQIDIAVEEVFVNIVHYAYAPNVGDAEIRMKVDPKNREAVIELRDEGVPFDPLLKPDPNVTLSAEERDIGGLGIYMVKQSMNKVEYRYEDGQNILTLRKNLN